MGNFFHKGYYKEVFRQLRTAGIVSAGVLALFTLTSGINSAGLNYIPSARTMANLPMLYAYVMGFVLTLSAYSWLNKRNRSDFYHALPISRRAMFFTTFAAIMTWLLIGLAGSAVVNTLLNLVFFRPFNYLLYLCVLVNVIISCITIVAAVSLACALTGTPFINFIAALVILFLPRVLFTIMGMFVLSLNSTLVLSNVSFLFDPSFNVAGTFPYVAVFSSFGAAVSIDWANVIAMLYSLVYSVLLLLLGCRMFVARKSELAGTPAKSMVLQTAVGCAFGLPLLLILAFGLLDGWDHSGTWPFFLVLFSFVAFCLYFLISTKSAKKMCKAMPLYLICVAIAALYVFLPRLIVKSELGLKADKTNVRGYSIEAESPGYYFSGLLDEYFEAASYSQMMTRKIEFTDERSVDLVLNAYNNTNDRGDNYLSDYVSDYDAPGSYAVVRIDRKGGKDIVRKIYFNNREMAELKAIWQDNEQYNAAQTDFPTGTLYYNVSELDPVESAKLGRIFAEEYKGLSDEAKLIVKNDENIYGTISSLLESTMPFDISDVIGEEMGTITVNGCRGVENFVNSYSISKLTPKTLQAYIDILCEENYEKGAKKLREIESAIERTDNFSWDKISDFFSDYFFVNAMHDSNGATATINRWDLEDAETAKLYKELIGIYSRGERADSAEGCVKINCGAADRDGSYTFFVKLTPEDEARAQEIISSINGYIEDGYDDDLAFSKRSGVYH